ncbi:MAG: FAD-dependent oxidoreductase [Cytophagaceae bacterium]|nr:FAD-dependent oxidoreductase [Cytophagaceae bacterium]
MKYEIILRLLPKDASDDALIKAAVAKQLNIPAREITEISIRKRSIDARHYPVSVQLHVEAYTGKVEKEPPLHVPNYRNVLGASEVVVVGAGPGGLFAALRLIELGLKPIVIERGKEVSERKKDLAQLNRNNPVNPESNYAFGEGGAGTFSDGKLNTRSKKRGSFERILEILHFHGADSDILIDAHPHVGTDRLPQIIKNMRQTIVNAGGEVLFNTRMTDIIVENNTCKGIVTAKGETIAARAVILATGHSARDVYELLYKRGIDIEFKPFAMGVRVEHPQELIDRIQYHNPQERDEYLPPATYAFTCQSGERGVYSFCMCPGGHIVPAMTDGDQMVVNGMSASQRNSPFANSGIVVEIRCEDVPDFDKYGTLAGLMYQQQVEQNCLRAGGRHITAPAQRLTDFVNRRLSFDLPACSYLPGIVSAPLHFILPEGISTRLRDAFKTFGRRAKGFLTKDAVVVGTESRTSSPVRIPRNAETLQHIHIKGLFPCGEGAGYAGGIASSAIDGERCAEKCAEINGLRNIN